MTEFGDCAREGVLRYNSATSLADNLLNLFTTRIGELYQSSHDTMDSFFAVRASMFEGDLTVPHLEAKAMELRSLVERLEAKGHAVEALLHQIDLDAVSKLLTTLPMYRDLTEAQSRSMILEYCEDVRLKFYWMRPQALAIKKKIISGTLLQAKKARIEVC
ncbi:hypothetical protein P171DRAFT_512279 [Karstenula rhodostoma CBS 690.94]|uniref:Uncharacterized protein n=1 Tax=Karstenula rhodostoma CBS 690.94 TaxID=1392251 RepID=A0A9P4UC98_9PLEO|nr:hypothetical protein P171DRAFT_512279 [Karstenula rhodostoma CBS 690.94]